MSRLATHLVWVLLLPLLCMTSCGAGAVEDEPPLVMVSVLPQKYVVERLAKELVRVDAMIPPGASPATYEPSVAAVLALQGAALYVKVGHPNFPFEKAWLDRMLSEVPGLPVVDASQGLGRVGGDPHIWVAPRQVEKMAIAIEAALRKLLPDDHAALEANLAAFRKEIDTLDADIRALLDDRKGARFLVLHPAWGYFAEAYGLEQVSIEHDHKSPDPHDLGELIEHARETEVEIVFVQPQFDPAAAKALASEIGARVETLDPLAYDWAANLRKASAALAEATVP